MNLNAVEMKAYVPAKDFERSLAFYKALGFEVPWHDDEYAYVRYQETSFLLQKFFVSDHAHNFMMHLLVEDVDAWRAHVKASGVVETFGVKLGELVNQPWKMRDFPLHDPSGVLWWIAQNID